MEDHQLLDQLSQQLDRLQLEAAALGGNLATKGAGNGSATRPPKVTKTGRLACMVSGLPPGQRTVCG